MVQFDETVVPKKLSGTWLPRVNPLTIVGLGSLPHWSLMKIVYLRSHTRSGQTTYLFSSLLLGILAFQLLFSVFVRVSVDSG